MSAPLPLPSIFACPQLRINRSCGMKIMTHGFSFSKEGEKGIVTCTILAKPNSSMCSVDLIPSHRLEDVTSLHLMPVFRSSL